MKTSDDAQMHGVYETVRARAGYIGPQWRGKASLFLPLQPHIRILTSRHLFSCMWMIPPSLVEGGEQMDGFEASPAAGSMPRRRLIRCCH